VLSSNKTPRYWFAMDREGRIGALELGSTALLPRGALLLGEPDATLDLHRAAAWLAVYALSEDFEDLVKEGDGVHALAPDDVAAHYGVLIDGAPSAALTRAVEAGRLDAARVHASATREPLQARAYVTRAPLRASELDACLLGTRVVGSSSGAELYMFWESIFLWRQQKDGYTYALEGEGHGRADDLPPEWRAALKGVPRLDVDFSAVRGFLLADVCTADDLVPASATGDIDERALRRRFDLHGSAAREAQDAARPDARFKIGEAPWVPDRLACRGRVLLTEPLATWFPDFDLEISDWKDRRHYVDARDVTAATFRQHPATLLHERHVHLRKLADMTPIFALGRDPREHDRLRDLGARVYTVGFVRTADDGFEARMEGPGVKRSLTGAFRYIEDAARTGAHGDREELIERILHALTDGRVDQCAMYLAEEWAALAGAGSLLGFSADEREAYLDSREASLDEVLARARAHRGIVDLALTIVGEAEAACDRGLQLPWLGDAKLARREAFEIRAGGGITVAVDGEPTLAVPAERGRIVLHAEPRSWLPEAERRRRAQPRAVVPAPPNRTGWFVAIMLAGLVIFFVLVAAITMR
jgi:hypothetical protein